MNFSPEKVKIFMDPVQQKSAYPGEAPEGIYTQQLAFFFLCFFVFFLLFGRVFQGPHSRPLVVDTADAADPAPLWPALGRLDLAACRAFPLNVELSACRWSGSSFAGLTFCCAGFNKPVDCRFLL